MKYLLSLCLLALSSSVMFGQTAGLNIGDKPIDFSLKGVDGEKHSLASVAGEKGTIVIFTCNSCPYSIAYEDRIVGLQEIYGPQGYPVVAINPNDPAVKPADGFQEMQVRANEKSFNFPYLFDEGQKVYPVWGATKTPHVFLLDADMKVRYIGAIDNNIDAESVTTNFLADAIASLEKGENPDPETTKAIGCSIKKQSK